MASYTSLLKHAWYWINNPKAAPDVEGCIQRHNHIFSSHKLPQQIDYGDDVNQKTNPNLMRDPTQEVDI